MPRKSTNSALKRAKPAEALAPQQNRESTELNSLSRHPRFLNPFDSNQLRVDVSGPTSIEPTIREFDLASVTLNMTVGMYPIKRILPLTDFPEWLLAIKAAVNKGLPPPQQDMAKADIGALIWSLVRIAIFHIRKGHYSPSTISSGELLKLGQNLCRESWFEILEVQNALNAYLEAAQTNPTLYTDILGKNLPHIRTISREKLSAAIGIPLWILDTPVSFRKTVYSALDSEMPQLGAEEAPGPSRSALKMYTRAVRLLSLSGPSGPSLPSVPLAELSKLLEDTFGEQAESTANLTPEQSVKIFAECVKWIYTYSNAVLECLRIYRSLARAAYAKGETSIAKALDETLEEFRDVLSTFELGGFEELDTANRLLRALVNCLFCAIGALCATLNGRRINEVVGNGVAYGFYFGCVISDGPAHRVESWLQKQGGRTGWRFFPACEMVDDCVRILEELDNLMLPIQEEAAERSGEPNEERLPKLFRYRDFRHDTTLPAAYSHNWTDNCDLLLKRVGLSRAILNGSSPPFRRLHITLHKFRFEYPELLALNHQVGQLKTEHLKPYYTDRPGRNEEDTLARLWRRKIDDDIDFLSDSAAKELVALYVQRFLSGEKVGGRFPLVIAAVSRQLMKRAQFASASPSERHAQVTAGLVRKGYRGNEGPGGPCMMGTSRVARHHAKCGGDVSRKSVSVCHGCLNNCTSGTTLSIYQDEFDALKSQSENFRLPPAARARAKDGMKAMQQLMEAERNLSEDNQAAYAKVFMMVPTDLRRP